MDVGKYMALVYEDDREYYTEQRNWFLIYRDAVTSDFSVKVIKAERTDDNTVVATLLQHYLYGTARADRTIRYEARFIKTPGGWKDADLNFVVKETPHFTVKIQREIESNAPEAMEEAEKAYASVLKALGLEPPGKITLKLYEDQETLRQSSDIRVAFLFNGWAEDGESIKMYGRRDRSTIAPLVAHELTHKITLAVTDSQCSWLAEGMANYFGSQPFRGNPLQLNVATAEELAVPIAWLEETNLTQLTDDKSIKIFYAASSMVIEFMVETYGVDRLKALLAELAKNPRYDRGHDYAAMEQENQKRLHQAIQTVMGVDMNAFNRLWLGWIRSKKA